ncbi:FAD-binding oxidoreductase [Shewanella schlegeliana]|uniref:FAD-binding oxidoreductase n=1 Tax=Shewanella schlegeliana TaxID=190308 RepID=A0ABS1SUP7_9GAMM|nr:FAD-binding oxidoreductase [Shewanella schlegeliana]MBL4912268.1 FAD-binding oxidoreductase [Shewanella schlegeliana]MCL1108263.1 FAD-binding oxidoreductase [Shewanella schlegeliana]GIU22400.1 FAD-dependent oxidoreductase [Shewanella schlegeliana]
MSTKSPVHSDQYPASYYFATARELHQSPRLEEVLDVDVCVVGGGFSGINTAIELAQKGFSVALLEAKRIGWGASGRNGGELIRGIGHDVSQFQNIIGSEGVKAIEQMGFEAVNIVRQRVAEHNIDCNLQMGYCDLAIRPRHMRELEEDFEHLNSIGYGHNMTLLDKSRIGEVIGSDFYQGALVDMASGHLHPLNLALGEARVARSLGVKTYEYSAAHKIVKGDKPKVITEHGEVNCQYLVLAGNAYLGLDLEENIGSKILPAGTYVLATEPLTQEQCDAIIPQNMAFADLRVDLDYYHLSEDNRLLFGGLCTYSGKDPKDIEAALRPNIEKVFPQLKGVRIDYEWGGMMGIGANRLPQIGRLPDAKNIFYAQAYAGHGVNATHMAAKLIAEAITTQAERFDIFAKVPHMTFPGGPHLRSPMLAMGMLYHRFKDIF